MKSNQGHTAQQNFLKHLTVAFGHCYLTTQGRNQRSAATSFFCKCHLGLNDASIKSRRVEFRAETGTR
jgi:hypothetical protein